MSVCLLVYYLQNPTTSNTSDINIYWYCLVSSVDKVPELYNNADAFLYICLYMSFERGSTVFHEEQEVGNHLSGILYMGLGTKNVQFTFRYPSFVHKVARTWEQQMVE